MSVMWSEVGAGEDERWEPPPDGEDSWEVYEPWWQGLGPVRDVPSPHLEGVLADLGFEADERQQLSAALVAAARHHGSLTPVAVPGVVLHGVRAMASTRSRLDADLLVAVQELALMTGRRLLDQRAVGSPEDLSATALSRWRQEVKSCVAGELQLTLGVRVGEARDLVGVACAPGALREPVLGALRRGEATWALVRTFWQKAGRLAPDLAVEVAQALFGTDSRCAAVERLTPAGELSGGAWQQVHYAAALEREVCRAQGTDAETARRRRQEAYAARGTSMRVQEDGTAAVTFSGPLTTCVAVYQRIDAAARKARKNGDERTLAQLRADICAALLLHGRVDLPEVDVDELVTPEDLAALSTVMNATPAVALQVVVPWDVLLGAAVCNSCRRTVVSGPGSSAEADARTAPSGPPGGRCGPVGELLGAHPAFLSPEHVRELALTPGTVIHRLLVDPADGRCVERTIKAYRPDAQMRRQIWAADVYSRGPGSRTPMGACELDHEIEWQDGGQTCEQNLNAKNKLEHWRKTTKLWRTVMTPRRDVTWTSLLGQVVGTRCHDYRQYLPALNGVCAWRGDGGAGDAGAGDHDAGDDVLREQSAAERERSDLLHRRDLAGQVLYAAIVHRRPGEPVRCEDDLPEAEDSVIDLAGWAWVTHEGPDGSRRSGGPPQHPTAEELLGLSMTPSGMSSASGGSSAPECSTGDTPAAGARTVDSASESAQSWASRMRRDEPPPF